MLLESTNNMDSGQILPRCHSCRTRTKKTDFLEFLAQQLTRQKASNWWPILSLLLIRIAIAVCFVISVLMAYLNLASGIVSIIVIGIEKPARRRAFRFVSHAHAMFCTCCVPQYVWLFDDCADGASDVEFIAVIARGAESGSVS